MMEALTERRPPQTDGHSKTTQLKDNTKQAEEKILGAVILQPQLAACIPLAIHAQFSCYGLFLIKACSAGWGIESIRHALDSFGLDGDGIVNTALMSIQGDPINIFWKSTRHLCERLMA